MLRKPWMYQLALLLVCQFSHAAEPPKITDARLEVRSAAAGLEDTIRRILEEQTGTVWIGYAAPVIAGQHEMCCYGSEGFERSSRCCGDCQLEEGRPRAAIGQQAVACQANLESGDEFHILLRAAGGRVTKVRPYSADCALDADGLAVAWLSDVRPAESVAYLSALARASRFTNDDVARQAIDVLALHADASAEEALTQMLAPGNAESLRAHAAFWLAGAHGKVGLQTVLAAFHSEKDAEFRKQAVFAISQSKEPDALPKLIQIARGDHDPEARSEALFWLAQAAGRKVAGVISDAIENDPETEVKKKAVFSLSEMPDNEGVPLLISVARGNKNPVLRKEAIFWLGQSDDPRALDYIAAILR